MVSFDQTEFLVLRFQLSKEERDALDKAPDGSKTMEDLAKHRYCAGFFL